MDIKDLERVVSKICGPIIIVGAPLLMALFIHALIVENYQVKPSKSEIGVVFIVLISILWLGVYMCKKEYGWFRRK